MPTALRPSCGPCRCRVPICRSPARSPRRFRPILEKVGIRARIVSWEWGTYLDKVFDGQHQMALLGWTGDNGDPDNFLYVLLDSTAAIKPAQNIAFYRSTELHDALVAARRSTDRGERTRLYAQAQEIVHRDAPWVPLVHATQTVVFQHRVTGFQAASHRQQVVPQHCADALTHAPLRLQKLSENLPWVALSRDRHHIPSFPRKRESSGRAA